MPGEYGGDEYGHSTYGESVPDAVADLTVTANDATGITLDWDPVPAADDYVIYRSQTTGTTISDYTPIGSPSAPPFTDNNREDGEQYYYRAQARNTVSGTGELSGEVSAVAYLPPTEITDADTATQGEITLFLNVQDNSTDGSIEIYQSTDGTLGSVTASVTPSTSSVTISVGRDGEQYHYTPRRVTDHVESDGSQVFAVSLLPDEDPPTLGNGVEDEIAIDRETQVSNYGDVRVQARETGALAWDSSATGWDEQVLAYDTLSTIVTGREDGEEYEVRARTETEHATGAWTEPVSIITQFPGATSVSVASSTSTSVTVDGQDNADNEVGFELEREERIDGEWRDRRVVVDAPPNSGEGSITITDDTPSPGTEYRYRIRPYTEHTSAVSNWTDAVTTESLDGVTRKRTGSSGWQLRVEHQDGSVHRPRTVGSPSYQPTINGLPTARVPVPQDEKWHAKGFETAHVEAWVDGRRLPVDELVDVEDESDRMILVLEGGRKLRDRVQREVDDQDAHLTAQEIITQDVGYAATVDDPAADTRGDVLMQEGDTTTELQQVLPGYPFPADDPRTVDNGRITTHQCATYTPGEEMTGSGGSEFFAPRYAHGSAARVLAISSYRETTESIAYDYPDGEAQVGVRADYGGDTHPGFDIIVDGTTITTIAPDSAYLGSDPEPQWISVDVPGGLAAGDHTIRLEITDPASDDSYIYWDAVTLFDGRYTNLANETLTNGGRLSYPRLHPTIPVETRDADSIEQVVAGTLEVTMTSTVNGQAVAISNDQGETWHEASNSSAVQGEFATGSPQIRARFTLSYYDTGGGDVVYDGAAAVDAFELSASLEDTPLLVNKSYDGSVLSVLNEIAEYGNFIWQLTWDSDIDGYRVEWTQPGQRTNSLDPSVVDYTTNKRMGDMRYGTAVVKGSNRPVSGERFTSSHGSEVQLYQDDILEGSEAVLDPGDGTQYTRGDDYTMDYSTGAVAVLASGEMADATEYAIDYRYRTQGSYTSPSADSEASELVRSFAGATDDRECGQIALNIIKNIQGPVWEVSLQIDSLPPGQLLVDEIAWPIPTQDRTVEIRSVDSGPGSVEVTGKGQSLGEVVSDIRGRVEAVSQRS